MLFDRCLYDATTSTSREGQLDRVPGWRRVSAAESRRQWAGRRRAPAARWSRGWPCRRSRSAGRSRGTRRRRWAGTERWGWPRRTGCAETCGSWTSRQGTSRMTSRMTSRRSHVMHLLRPTRLNILDYISMAASQHYMISPTARYWQHDIIWRMARCYGVMNDVTSVYVTWRHEWRHVGVTRCTVCVMTWLMMSRTTRVTSSYDVWRYEWRIRHVRVRLRAAGVNLLMSFYGHSSDVPLLQCTRTASIAITGTRVYALQDCIPSLNQSVTYTFSKL